MTPASHLRHLRVRLTLLLAAAVALGALCSPVAYASYGGLGRVDEAIIQSGTEGNHGQVNPGTKPASHHALAVDPSTGDIFVGDEFFNKSNSKNEARVQEFSPGPSGAFIAEGRIKLTRLAEHLAGLAVDPVAGRLYMLIEEERPGEEEIEEKIEGKEESLEKKREKHEPTEELEKEIAELKAKLPLFDPEQPAASELAYFTIPPTGEALSSHNLVPKTALLPTSETGDAPLLDPSGLAVDPTTHDILILGQQDESTSKALQEGESAWHTAIQRVHETGELGPRYIDGAGTSTVNCLDQGLEPADQEPACREDAEEFPTSPIVTSSGKVLIDDLNEVWEAPASANASEAFATVEAVKHEDMKPRRLIALEGPNLKAVFHEGEGGSMSYVPKGAEEGLLYVNVDVTENGSGSGIAQLRYTESAGKPQVSEIGWTGGQTHEAQVKCALPSGNATPVLIAAGGGEDVFALITSPSFLSLSEYGPGGEACGAQPTAAKPTVEAGGKLNPAQVTTGETVTLSSKMTDAQATSVTWTITNLHPEAGEKAEETIESGYLVQSSPKLEHAFAAAGEYEVKASIASDSLAYPALTTETVKVVVVGLVIHLPAIGATRAQQATTFTAKLEDPGEKPAHFKAIWNFGDGTMPETKSYEGDNGVGTSTSVVEIKHTYATPGNYKVTLEVEDESGLRHAIATLPSVQVGESVAEEQAKAEATRKRQEEEAAALALKQHQETEAAALALKQHQEAEAAARKHQEEEAAAAAAKKRQEEEAAAARKRQEEAAKAKAKPLTRAQLLVKALKTCKKQPKKKRAKCEATARKRYGPKKKKK